MLTAGSYGNVLRFLPPLVISDDLLHDGLDVLEKALAVLVARDLLPRRNTRHTDASLAETLAKARKSATTVGSGSGRKADAQPATA